MGNQQSAISNRQSASPEPRIPLFVWWKTACALALLFGAIATARAQSTLNVVYMESNIGSIPNDNSIYAYSLDTATGILTALPGSPYLTNGTGVYDPGDPNTEFDADQEVQIDPTSLILFAVNGHSDTISTFAINSSTGALTAESGSPFPSNGQDPVSIGLAHDILGGGAISWVGVVNKNEDPGQNRNQTTPNLSMFKSNFGKMQLISGATVKLAADSTPSQALMQPSAHRTYLDTFGTATGPPASIAGYSILSTGAVSLINSVGPPVSGALILGLAQHPTQKYIYAGLPSLAKVGVYTYTSTGTISYVTDVKNQGIAVCWLAVNSEGTFLYTAESNSGTLTVYSLTHPAAPVQVQHFSLTRTGVTIPAPANLAFDPTGAYLYCLDNINSVLHVLAVNPSTGLLTEPNPPIVLPSPSGEEALGLATLMLQ